MNCDCEVLIIGAGPAGSFRRGDPGGERTAGAGAGARKVPALSYRRIAVAFYLPSLQRLGLLEKMRVRRSSKSTAFNLFRPTASLAPFYFFNRYDPDNRRPNVAGVALGI